MLFDTIKVQVGQTVKTYTGDVAGYGDFIRGGGRTITLHEARQQAAQLWAANAGSDWMTAVDFWATIDESGLAYHLSFTRSGHYSITAAAPQPGRHNVRDLYDASGYGTAVTVREGEDGLFEQIDAEGTQRCTACGAVGSAEADELPSMYAGSDTTYVCSSCGSYDAVADPFKGTRTIYRTRP